MSAVGNGINEIRRRGADVYNHMETGSAIAEGWNAGVRTAVKAAVVAVPALLAGAAYTAMNPPAPAPEPPCCRVFGQDCIIL